MENLQYLIVEPQMRPGVTLVRLNRPDALNALCWGLMDELGATLTQLNSDDATRVVVLTGSDRAFAAGADIKEMSGKGAIDMVQADLIAKWERIRSFKKPILAAVSGFALGGGNELCMLCDLVVASETAQFGQPEIKIGVIPGAGGTQRLTRAVGKARAMELVLTGDFMSAQEAHQRGLVNRLSSPERYLDDALDLAARIADMPPVAVQFAKECVQKAYELPLQEALQFERRAFYLLFSSEDQKEGMQAFIEKRKPEWKGR